MDEHNPLILVVEDDAAHYELVKICLKQGDIKARLFQVNNGEDAVAYLKKQGRYSKDSMTVNKPTFVLLDLHIPKLNGFEVLEIIKADEKISNIPVVIFTTSASEIDMKKAYENHANSFVVKPTDFGDFKKVLLDMASYWLSCNTIVSVD